jgi:hypothetical protein
MFLLRIAVIVILIMALIPLFNKGKEYFVDKKAKVINIGKNAKEIWNEKK